MDLTKPALRISAALVAILLFLFLYGEYIDHKAYPQVKNICSTIQIDSSIYQVQEIAKNNNLVFVSNQKSGKIQSGLCSCILAFEQDNVTKNLGASCTD